MADSNHRKLNISSVANWIFLLIWILAGLLIAKFGQPGAYGHFGLTLAIVGAWIMTRDSDVLALTVVGGSLCFSFGFLEMALNGEGIFTFVAAGAAMLLAALYVIFIQQGRYDYRNLDIAVCIIAFLAIGANLAIGVVGLSKYCNWVTRGFAGLLAAAMIAKIVSIVRRKTRGLEFSAAEKAWKSRRWFLLIVAFVIFAVAGLLSRFLPAGFTGFLFLVMCFAAGIVLTRKGDPRTRIVNFLMVFVTLAIFGMISLPAQDAFAEALELAGATDSLTHIHLLKPALDLILLLAARIGSVYEAVISSLFIYNKPLLALVAKIPFIDPAWFLEPNTILRGAFCWLTCFACTMIGVYAGAYINKKKDIDWKGLIRRPAR